MSCPCSLASTSLGYLPVATINGQQYPPVANGPRYWLPICTTEGQAVLRPANQAPQGPPAYAATAVAAPAWVEAKAPDGRSYWYKEGTQETTWENPYANSSQQMLQQPVHPPAQVWNQVVGADGKPYYHNPTTNQTAWQLPPGAMVAAPSAQFVQPQQQMYVAQPVANQQQAYVAQHNSQATRAPSRELRQQRLHNARNHGGGMSFW